MKLNKTFVVLMAIMCVFALAGTAFANNRVEVKVTSEPLPEGTSCSKGGGFSLEFDTDTSIKVGDQITIDLEYIASTNKAVLCRDIDLEISNGGSGTGWTKAAIEGNGNDGPVYYIDGQPPVAEAKDLATGANSVYFRIKGTAGQQRITIDVMGNANDAITVGNESSDRLVINFLDQKTNASATFNFGGIYIDDSDPADGNILDDKDNVYSTVAQTLHNTLCLNVSAYQKSTVNGNMDSKDDKYTFIPSNPQIAHIAAPSGPVVRNISLTNCTKANPGIIEMGSVQGKACKFDYEQNTGYCDVAKLGTRRAILYYQNGTWDPAYAYTAVLEIKVDGKSGDNGVYFTAQNVGIATYASVTDICNDTAIDQSYSASCQTGTTCAAAGDCKDVNKTRITQATAPDAGNATGITTGRNYLWVDIPEMAYNTETTGTKVAAGQNVRVSITIKASNPNSSVCGGAEWQVGPFEVNVGTFGSCGQNFSIVYPYLLPTADGWWSGLTIANMGDTTGTATVYIYEMDGDSSKATYTIDAKSMKVTMFPDLITAATKMGGAGTLGDKAAYAIVCADFNVDGFAFLGNNELGQGNGYIPRAPAAAPAICNQ